MNVSHSFDTGCCPPLNHSGNPGVKYKCLTGRGANSLLLPAAAAEKTDGPLAEYLDDRREEHAVSERSPPGRQN